MPSDSVLWMWVIYCRPLDYPRDYVVRRWGVLSGGQTISDNARLIAPTLERARELVPGGLHRMPREPNDDPVIVETWL